MQWEEIKQVSTAKTKKAAVAAPAVTTVDWLRVIAIGLSVLGILVSGYLSWAEITGNETQCVNTGNIDCEAVQNSAYAKTLGFPVAVLGLLGFVAILGVLVLEDQIPILAEYGRTLVLGLTLFSVMFFVYLTLIEATVLDAWCQWCVAAAITMVLLFGIASYRVYDRLRLLQR
jgi:uncharacterized membrane protein